MFAPLNETIRKSAASLAGRSRRGTVLLLVLGALALVLILSVVYAALGKGDRRTAGSVVERLDAQENVEGIGNHILDTLALDVFSLVPDVAMDEALTLLGENDPIMRREVTDMPYTDFFHISVPSALFSDPDSAHQTGLDAIRFRPYGSHSAEVTWDGSLVNSSDAIKDLVEDYTNADIPIDPRVASDPFLASTRPVDLGYRDFDNDYNPFENRRDWLQISNFAPDGTFKNLYYLRDDADDGGFDAPSLNLTREPGTDNARLSLMDEQGRPVPFLPFPEMITTPVLGRIRADWNRPAHWTMYQRNLFRPVNDPDFPDVMINPGDPDYWAYQYADADGDGMLDSRWIELVDSADETRPTQVLGDSDYRFFAAIRAVDLSSLVNVTTATDFLTPPSTSNRLGQGAHEINLFKLFNQTEHHYAHGNGFPLGYEQAFLTGTGTAGDYGAYDIAAGQQLGRKAYLRMMDGALSGWIQRYGAVPGEENRNAVLSDDLDDYTIFDDVEERAVYASNLGTVYPGTSSGGNNRLAPYGIDDLVELLTFHGINDDQNFSLLEKALTSSNANNPLSLSMLRSDSPTELDAWPQQQLQDDYSGAGNYAMDDRTRAKLARSAVDVRRLLTTVSGHRPLRSSILDAAEFGNLTEITDRKRWLNGLVLDDGNHPNDDDGNSIDEYREEQYALVENAFGLYMDLLAPNLNQGDWDRLDQERFDNTRTQYYGHMGPELAVRLAGHMALNFRDMADTPIIDLLNGTSPGPNGVPDVENILNLDLSDPATLAAYQRREDIPTAAVLRLSDNWMPTLGAGATDLMDQMWEAGMKLDIEQLYEGEGYDFNDPQHIALSGLDNVSHDAMILYGVEPQPFLSQATSISMYTDTPRGLFDSDSWNFVDPVVGEWESFGDGADGIPGSEDDYDGLPSIVGDADDPNNADFVFQAVFFQLFNPFDTPIVLDQYYLEFADSFYSVTNGSTVPVIMPPRSTVVLWAANPNSPAEIVNRLINSEVISGLTGSGGSDFLAMINSQIGTDVDVYQLTRFESSGTQLDLVPEADVRDLFHDDPANQSDANRVVLLWRDNPQVNDPTMGLLDWSLTSLSTDDRATDQLVDRMRDTSQYETTSGPFGSGSYRAALDRRLDLGPLPSPIYGSFTINNAIDGSLAFHAAPGNINGSGWLNANDESLDNQLGLMMWGNISRLDDNSYDSGRAAVDYYSENLSGVGQAGAREVTGTPVGALPAQVFEAAPDAVLTPTSPLINNVLVAGSDNNTFYPQEMSMLVEFLENGLSETVEPMQSDLQVSELWDRYVSGSDRLEALVALGTPVLTRDTTLAVSSQLLPNTISDFGPYEGGSYIKVTLNQNEFRDIMTGRQTIRVGDMLLPLAIGSYRTPLETAGPAGSTVPADPTGIYDQDVLTRLDQYEAQWTTLSEALAAGAGYADSVGPQTSRELSGGPSDPFAELSYEATGFPDAKQDNYVLDRGHLRLDAFASYIDLGDGSGNTPNGTYEVETDVRRGLGIPMALEIFDMAQAGSELGFEAMGSIDRPVMGTINTNTADPQVLRLSPVLSKDVHNTAGVTVFDRLWWPEFTRNVTENDSAYQVNAFVTQQLGTGGAPAIVYSADVGSTIADYRDAARYSRHNPGGLGGPGGPLAMEEVADTVVDYVDPNEEELGLLIDRAVNSGMDIIRTEPGIGSMGELLGARNVDPANVENQHHMDGFSRDNRTDGVAFIDRNGPNRNPNYGRGTAEPRDPQDFVRNNTLSMDISSFGGHLHGDLIGASYATRLLDGTLQPADLEQVFPGYLDSAGTPYNSLLPLMPDQVPDDYGEQLTQLNAVLNSMSVGSDYYAVWYLVHGYKEADTIGLSEQDPLTPSFKARYLMIVDRSNVTERGDRPKVLAFVQVPAELPGSITSGD